MPRVNFISVVRSAQLVVTACWATGTVATNSTTHAAHRGNDQVAASLGSSPRARLFYINDHATKGCDPDNEQTLVHLLFHADLFQWEGIVGEGGTNCATDKGGLPPGQNAAEVLRVLDAYNIDFPALVRGHAAAGLPGAFPTPQALRGMVTQGVNMSSPSNGVPPTPTAASRALVEAARRSDPHGRPLWVVTGGSLSDVSRALYDAPDIIPNIRVYSIGAWNTQQDPASRLRLSRIPSLWWIEANTTFRGVYEGGNQTGPYNDATLVSEYVSHAGALGALYWQRLSIMKEGDMSGLLYLMGPQDTANTSDPSSRHWGGQYRLVSPPSHWGDLASGSPPYPQYPGAQTVSEWRTDIIDVWILRMKWLSVASTVRGGDSSAAIARTTGRRMPTSRQREDPYGFSIHGLNATDAALVKNAGATWVRFQFQWRDIQPTRDTWDWTAADSAVAEANRAGLRVLFDLLMAPDWALTQTCDPTRPDKKILPNAIDFAAYAAAVAKRYDGTMGRPFVDAFEVGNEEFDNYWGGDWQSSKPCREPQLYAPVLRHTYEAIKTASPRALVGFAGLWWLDEQHIREYYSYFSDNNLTQYFDFANFHYYPCKGSPLNSSTGIAFALVLDWVSSSVPNKPVWLTEFGWTVSDKQQSASCIVSPSEQGAFMCEVFDLARMSPVVQRVFWYTICPPWGKDGMSLTKFEQPTTGYETYRNYTAAHPSWS